MWKRKLNHEKIPHKRLHLQERKKMRGRTWRSAAKAAAFLLFAPVASRFRPLPLVSANFAAISASFSVSSAVLAFFLGGALAFVFSAAFLLEVRVPFVGSLSSRSLRLRHDKEKEVRKKK